MPLKSLKIEGSSTLSATPTPSAPANIVCNNGTLSATTHESGLPLEYTLLDSVGCSSSHDITTPIYLASTDVVECRFRNSSTNGYGALYGTFALGESSAFYANGTYYGYNASNTKIDTDIDIDTNWHTLRHDFVNGEITIDEKTTTFTPFTFTNSDAMHIFSRYYNKGYGYYWKGYISYFKVYRNGELICNYIPAKYDGNVGVYDLVNKEFLFDTNILEGSVVEDPVHITTVGTPNTISFNSQTAQIADLFAIGNYKDEQDIVNGEIIRRVGIKVLDGTEVWGEKNATTGLTLTRVNDMLNQSSAPLIVTHGEWSASAEKDSDKWRIVVGPYLACLPSQETTADFKAWLAAQYAAGTPVIVLYPLATETIEHKSPTTWRTTFNTTNTITATDNITVKYWKKPF